MLNVLDKKKKTLRKLKAKRDELASEIDSLNQELDDLENRIGKKRAQIRKIKGKDGKPKKKKDMDRIDEAMNDAPKSPKPVKISDNLPESRSGRKRHLCVLDEYYFCMEDDRGRLWLYSNNRRKQVAECPLCPDASNRKKADSLPDNLNTDWEFISEIPIVMEPKTWKN